MLTTKRKKPESKGFSGLDVLILRARFSRIYSEPRGSLRPQAETGDTPAGQIGAAT